MARSPKDDPRYNDNTWNFAAEAAKQCTPGGINERKQPPIPPNTAPLNENIYANANYTNDMFMNKVPFSVQPRETVTNDENLSFNNMQGVTPVNRQNYGSAGMVLHLSNGQSMRAFYDENNQQLVVPVSSQYELFSHNQGPLDISLQTSQTSHMFNMNQDYCPNNNMHSMPSAPIAPNNYVTENLNHPPNNLPSELMKVLRDNWEPNSTGTYSPFGQNHPLKHPETSSLNLPGNPLLDNKPLTKPENSPKRNENGPLADTSTKKRIVAEVKPMRPTYSDVLVKNTKNNTQTETPPRTKPKNVETKPSNIKTNSKLEKPPTNLKHNDESKLKGEKKHNSTISSGSESGDVNTDDADKSQKPKKSKSKRSNISRKWSSLDDITNEEDVNYEHNNESQFVFIENQEKPLKKEKKCDKKAKVEKDMINDEDYKLEEDELSQFVFQENQTDAAKAKKKKESRSFHKINKPLQDKKKASQSKVRRNKPGYLGLAQGYMEHWGGATWKAFVWFAYLLSDICGMSLHLSFDLCTSVFTQTYVSSQAVWRSTKDWLYKMRDNKYLMYIDRKFGHTRFAFWRKLKWFKREAETDSGNDSTKLNTNIPLPATGEEAMKRLLACKGKDPYSILGVSVTCSDEDIKRYYRRQAFLVHPDKNQQPGAEEAFKILQHAFDLIGEPERREAYSRRALESRHAEAAWSELSTLLAQLHDKMEFAANTIRCTNCGRRHKRVLTDRPCYAARYCVQCKIRHSAKEGDIWAESSMMGLLVMYYACMDGAVYQITQWASCQKKNLKQLRPDCHVVQYRIVLGNKAAAAADLNQRPSTGPDPNLEEFLNNLYSRSGMNAPASPPADADARRRRHKKTKP